jgi:hypothetical protein
MTNNTVKNLGWSENYAKHDFSDGSIDIQEHKLVREPGLFIDTKKE